MTKSRFSVDIRLIIFDVDGTLRYTKGDNSRPPFTQGEWGLLPNVLERIAEIKELHPEMEWGLATNQRSTGRGLLSRNKCMSLLDSLCVAVFGKIISTTAIQICPHLEPCQCRKPEPLMLVNIMNYRGVSPENTLFVGDAESDGLAAKRAKCHFAWADEWFCR